VLENGKIVTSTPGSRHATAASDLRSSGRWWNVSQRARGWAVRLVSSSTPSPWVAVPVGFALAVLVTAAFDGHRSLVPFALYGVAMTIACLITSRSFVGGEILGLSLLAMLFGTGAVVFAVTTVSVLGDGGPGTTVLFLILVAATTSNSVIAGYFVSLIVKFRRRIR
jgi:hypothetical protein